MTNRSRFLQSNAVLASAALLAGLCLFPKSAYAIFGIADVVFDPSSYAVLGNIWQSNDSVLQKTTQSYTQMVALVRNAEQTYEFQKEMAMQFRQNLRQTLMSRIQPTISNLTRNQAGETAQWSAAINGRPELASSAWSSSTLPLTADATNHDLAVSPGFQRFVPDIATVEEQDGSAAQCLSILGQYHKSSSDSGAALQNLESAVGDDTSATNSNIEQLNELNLGNTQALNEQRAQGQLKACEVQQQLITNSYQRNTIVDDLNMQAKVRANQAAGSDDIGSMTDTLENYVP